MATIRDICTDALRELGVIGVDQAMDGDQATATRRKLERLLNNWNAERRAVYATVFSSFTLTPALSPHTIGPTAATFTVVQRPVTIEAIALELNTSSPSVFLELDQHDAEWWEAQTVPDLSTSYPTDFYYDATWPNGSIYFWPVPDTAYPVSIQIRVLLDDSIGLEDTFSLPPGYQDAITLTLAETCAPSYGAQSVAAAGAIADLARKARARIFENNTSVPRIQTADAGMQGPIGRGTRTTFNYLTRQF